MQKTVEIKEYSWAEVNLEARAFLQGAKSASDKAYAPYSEFYVGCLVERANGDFVDGANQENASFPSGLCAERTALFEIGKDLEKNPIKRLAVFARSNKYKVPKMLVPCAGCLQVISDMRSRQGSPIEIWMWDGGEAVFMASDVSEFLPFHFELERK